MYICSMCGLPCVYACRNVYFILFPFAVCFVFLFFSDHFHSTNNSKSENRRNAHIICMTMLRASIIIKLFMTVKAWTLYLYACFFRFRSIHRHTMHNRLAYFFCAYKNLNDHWNFTQLILIGLCNIFQNHHKTTIFFSLRTCEVLKQVFFEFWIQMVRKKSKAMRREIFHTFLKIPIKMSWKTTVAIRCGKNEQV